MALQSNEEMIRVADEWFRSFCPPNLIKDGASGIKNAELILRGCLQKHGVATISGMTEAAHELARAGSLALIPQPKVLSQAEMAEKLEAKMRQDYADSIAPQRLKGVQEVNQKKADADKKTASDTELKRLNSQIEFEISNFTVGHPSGVTDYSRTESGRISLRSVRDSQPDRRTIAGLKLTLSAVRAAKGKLS